MKPMTNSLREKIHIYIKNDKDISDLIRDVDIKGENLTGAIIYELNIHDQDISNTNFTRSIIGRQGTKPSSEPWVNMNRVIAHHCSFIRTTFPGIVWARYADFSHSNFKGGFAPYVDYKFANFSHCNFCDLVFCFGTQRSLGAKFTSDMFQDLAKYWNISITCKE